jgi:hypothetical protein
MTPVIFRMFEEECIALFPTILGDESGRYCSSYVHDGQHGIAAYGFVMKRSRSATPKEYEALLTELAQIGYTDLEVWSRRPAKR